MKQVLGPLVIAIAIITTSALFTHAYRTRLRAHNEISVVGSGTQDFDADLLTWNASFTRKNMDLKAAYAQLNEDRDRVQKFLAAHGAPEKDIVFSSIQIDKEFDDVIRKDESHTQTFTGFRLTQRVLIESPEVDKYEKIAREVTDLINSGVELTSNQPEYFYTKLPQLKIEMVAAATRDARQRAEKIAQNSGGKLGKLRAASLGVFQINGRNSSEEYSWKGNFNTGSRAKTAAVTARLQFEAE